MQANAFGAKNPGGSLLLPDVFQKPAAEASLYPKLIRYRNYEVQEVSKTKQSCQSNIYRVNIINLCLK